MIQKQTYLNVIDNSGAKTVCCIHISKGYRRRYANIGDIIVVSVKNLRIKRRALSKIKKGDVLNALIVRSKKFKIFSIKNSFSFSENSVILLNTQFKMLGTKIFGCLPIYLRYTKFLRVISLASGFVK